VEGGRGGSELGGDKKAGVGEIDEKSNRPINPAKKYKAGVGKNSDMFGEWNGVSKDSLFVCEIQLSARGLNKRAGVNE
jgi:hypothetical protein